MLLRPWAGRGGSVWVDLSVTAGLVGGEVWVVGRLEGAAIVLGGSGVELAAVGEGDEKGGMGGALFTSGCRCT